jgi:hypothetical protein
VIGATVFDWLYHAARWTWHDPDGYNFISGPLADITLLGGVYAILRRHNCHVKGCWRIGRHRVTGTDYVVCRHHHPDPPVTAEHVLAAHEEAAKRTVAVRDVRHRVAADIHEVAEDVHDVAEDVTDADAPPTRRPPPDEPPK